MFKSTIYLVFAAALFAGSVHAAPVDKRSPIVILPGSEPPSLYHYNSTLPYRILKKDLSA